MRGQFRVGHKGLILPNTIMSQGEEDFLKILLQGNNTIVAAGGNFYIGLCSVVAMSDELTLADLLEPTNAGGYSRKSIARSAVGWPTIGTVNGDYYARSASVTFSAAGADFSRTFDRVFLCSASSGTAGRLFAVSRALATPELISAGESYPVQYELFMR